MHVSDAEFDLHFTAQWLWKFPHER